MTLRDQVWDSVLVLIQQEGMFKISDLEKFDESQRHTVRRVLKQMEQLGWLTRESSHAKTWYAGEKTRELMDLEKRADVYSEEVNS